MIIWFDYYNHVTSCTVGNPQWYNVAQNKNNSLVKSTKRSETIDTMTKLIYNILRGMQ